MKRVALILGVVLLLFGVVGLVHPVFTYHKKEEVAKIGPIKATVDEEKEAEIPKAASVACLLLGLVLVIGAPRIK